MNYTLATMEVLIYDGLQEGPMKKQLDKVLNALKAGDFRTADVKKMPNAGYYRAKLDDKNRLLFKFSRYEGRTYILALEVILNHAYDKSRFLAGAAVDERRLEPISGEAALEREEVQPMAYVNPRAKKFRLLDKVLSFDEAGRDFPVQSSAHHHRLGRERQDGPDAGKDENPAGQAAIRHPFALPGGAFPASVLLLRLRQPAAGGGLLVFPGVFANH